MAVINPFDFFVEDGAKDWPFVYDPELKASSALPRAAAAPRPAGQEVPRIDPDKRKARSTSSPISIAGCAARSTYCMRIEPASRRPRRR